MATKEDPRCSITKPAAAAENPPGAATLAAHAAAGASKSFLPPLPAFADDTDGSQQDQHQQGKEPGQIALMTRLQSVLEADDEAGDSEGFEDLQVALQRVIKSKAAKNQQKQQTLLQETQASLSQQVRSLEAVVTKDLKDSSNLATNTFNGLSKKLGEKYQAIEELNKKYQQDLHGLWEDYNDIYSQLDDAKDQVLAVAEKRKAALKRKINALQVSSKDKLEEAEKKMTKIHSQASKLPNLSNMLKAAFM